MRNQYQKLDFEPADIPENPLHRQKIAVVGAEGVGKTQLVNSLMRIEDFDDEYHPTIGANQVILNEDNIVLFILDCSGSEKYSRLMSLYLRSVNQVLLTYDVHDQASLEALIPYIESVRKSDRAKDIKLILVGVLKDFYVEPVVTQAIAADFAAQHDLKAHFQVSSIVPEGTDALRRHLIKAETLDLRPDEEDFLERKKVVEEQLRIFKESAANESKEEVRKSIRVIANYLEKGLQSDNPNHYFFNMEEVLQEQLRTLQYTNASLYTSALNVILLTFACCTVFGMGALWLSGLLEKNAKEKGNPLLFADKGQKQQTEILMAKTVNLFKKP